MVRHSTPEKEEFNDVFSSKRSLQMSGTVLEVLDDFKDGICSYFDTKWEMFSFCKKEYPSIKHLISIENKNNDFFPYPVHYISFLCFSRFQ